MDYIFTPDYDVDIGTHVFPTQKYSLIVERLKAEGYIKEGNLHCPQRPSDDSLLKIITKEYLDDLIHARLSSRTFPSEMPVTHGIIDAQILCCDGTYRAAECACANGVGYHVGGGFHHAFPDHAEGFCFLNDVVYAAVMMLEKGVERIAVVDCDLHQGNGTAKFFENEKRVFTFSIHQEHLYPVKQRSDIDIGLDNGVGDEEYLSRLSSALDHIYGDFKPSLILYVAGSDPYILDQLGSLRITIDGLKKRDERVVKGAFERNIPVASVLAGGYAEDIEDTVEIHCNTARVMHEAADLKKKDN